MYISVCRSMGVSILVIIEVYRAWGTSNVCKQRNHMIIRYNKKPTVLKNIIYTNHTAVAAAHNS